MNSWHRKADTLTLLAILIGVSLAAPAAAQQIFIGDAELVEGNSGSASMEFTVSRIGLNSIETTVDYYTVNGTASTFDNDFVGIASTSPQNLVIPIGSSSATLSITINGDTDLETDEIFTVILENPINATIIDRLGDGTILNDDVEISIADASIAEGDSGTTDLDLTVSLSGTSALDVDVEFYTADGSATLADADYVEISSASAVLLTIVAGDTSADATVSIIGDLDIESDETFSVLLQSPVNGMIDDGTGTATILNDDAHPISIGDAAILEGDAGTTALVFDVTLAGANALDSTVEVYTMDGTATLADGDYLEITSGAPQIVTILAGQTSETATVTLNGDLDVEADEAFSVILQNPVNTSIDGGTGAGTILNDDEDTPPPANIPAMGDAARLFLILAMIGAALYLRIEPRRT
jgi:hypothetical protein